MESAIMRLEEEIRSRDQGYTHQRGDSLQRRQSATVQYLSWDECLMVKTDPLSTIVPLLEFNWLCMQGCKEQQNILYQIIGALKLKKCYLSVGKITDVEAVSRRIRSQSFWNIHRLKPANSSKIDDNMKKWRAKQHEDRPNIIFIGTE